MEAKHTPGPWLYKERTVYTDNVDIALIREPWKTTQSQAEANGYLIASAPDLLESLKRCADRLGEMDCSPELAEARRVIARATGETP